MLLYPFLCAYIVSKYRLFLYKLSNNPHKSGDTLLACLSNVNFAHGSILIHQREIFQLFLEKGQG